MRRTLFFNKTPRCTCHRSSHHIPVCFLSCEPNEHTLETTISILPPNKHVTISILPLLSSPALFCILHPSPRLLSSMICFLFFNKRSPFSLHHQCTLLYTSYPSYFRLRYTERGRPCDGVVSNISLFSSVLYCTAPSCLSFLPPFHLSPLNLLEPSSHTFLLSVFFCIPQPPPTYHRPTRSKFSF